MSRASVEDVLITAELKNRPGISDHQKENELLRLVAENWERPAEILIRKLVDRALKLCRAGSAGLSLLEKSGPSKRTLRWIALAGKYRPLTGSTIPRGFSPCGTTLDRRSPQLFLEPARHFTDLKNVQPAIYEALIIPLFAGERELGTLWVVSHDIKRRFDAEDARMLNSISSFTALALQHHDLQKDIARSEQFKHAILCSSPDCIKALDHAGRLVFVNDKGLELLGVDARESILNKKWLGFWRGENRIAADEALNKAKAGGIGTFQGYRPTLKGEPKWWDVCVTAITAKKGEVISYLVVSRDVTQRVEAEQKLAEYSAGLEKRVKERTEQLVGARDRLQGLARKLVCSQEDERRRIANEMHDEIGQQLTSLKIVLENAREEGNAGLIKADRLLAEIQKQVRSLSFSLRQSLPDHIDLLTGLKCRFREMEQNARIKIRFTQPEAWTESFGPEVKHTLYRIAQEALNNVIKHAKVKTASVSLQEKAGAITLKVMDQGRGFDYTKSKAKRSSGLALMEERIILLGGEFSIRTAPKMGTEIVVRLPAEVCQRTRE